MTRLTTARDVGYFVATQILPTIWIVYRLSELTFSASLFFFAAGFIAFVAVYEIGYFVNDAWDARRDPSGRRRMPFAADRSFFSAFIVVRVATWLAIGLGTGWAYNPTWLSGFACLVLVFGLHNFIRSGPIRAATFLQLAVLRFMLPALGAIGTADVVSVLAISVFLYAYLRFLSYLDDKHLLNVPERKAALYPLSQIAAFVPLAAFVSVATSQSVFLELTAYLLVLYGANALFGWGRQ